MQISDVKFRMFSNATRLRALVSVTIDNALAIHDIKIIEGDDKFFLAMPSRKLQDGTYRDIVHPVGAEMRKLLEDTVLPLYEETVKSQKAE